MVRPEIPGSPHAGRTFYGWRMVAVAFVVDFIAVGFFFYSYGVFLKQIAADLEFSRFVVSLGLSVSNGVGAIASPFIGRALDRLPIKRIMIAGSLAVGCGFLALSRMTALWHFYLAMGTLLGFGMAMMGGLASAKLVANWFDQRRGMALGIATVGVSFSGVIMPHVARWLIDSVGWRGGFLVYSALTVAIVAPLVTAFVVDRPEDLGLRLDGAPPPADPPSPSASGELHWRTVELLRNRNFWAIAIPFSLAFSSLSAVLIHIFPYATDLGIPSEGAAWIPAAAAGAGAAGKVVFGRLMDRIDARTVIWSSFGGQLLGLMLLMQGTGMASLLAAAVVFGFSMGGVVPLQGAVTARAFGRLSFGKALGLLRPVQMPFHMLGAPLAGWIFDSTGDYALAFRVFSVFYVVGIVCVIGLRLGPASTAIEPPSDGEAGLA